jgi:hypothetical protein
MSGTALSRSKPDFSRGIAWSSRGAGLTKDKTKHGPESLFLSDADTPPADEFWQDNHLGKEHARTNRRLAAIQAGLAPNRFNFPDHLVHLAMSNRSARVPMVNTIQ